MRLGELPVRGGEAIRLELDGLAKVMDGLIEFLCGGREIVE